MSNPIVARYLIETPHPEEIAAEIIAGEQSSGTFTAVPGETEELKARARAKVTEIKRLDEVVDAPSLLGCRPPKGGESPPYYRRAEICVEFPFEHTGPNLPTLVATICGNLYELAELSGIKLLDVELPLRFAEHYPGPQFGIEGTRQLTGVYRRPLIGTIIKPSFGLAALTEFRRRCQLPIHGYRNGWGMFSRHPLLGVEYRAWQKLWRLAGVDHLHVNGLQNKLWEPDDSVVHSIQACLKPMFRFDDTVMPVISSGQWGGQAPETCRRTGTHDVMYLAGGGILAHPLGPAAGLRALQQAWDAAVNAIPLSDYAKTHQELGVSLAKFGSLRK